MDHFIEWLILVLATILLLVVAQGCFISHDDTLQIIKTFPQFRGVK